MNQLERFNEIRTIGDKIVFIRIGEVYAAKSPAIFRTVLGSCVAVITHDNRKKIGGMAHIVLAEGNPDEIKKNPGKFANSGVSLLIRKTLEAGAQKKDIQGLVVGGNYTLNCQRCVDNNFDIGRKNVEAVRDILKSEKIPYKELNTLQESALKIDFDLETGECKTNFLKTRKQCRDCYFNIKKSDQATAI